MNALKFQKAALDAYMKKRDKRSACYLKMNDKEILLILSNCVGAILRHDEFMLDAKKLEDTTGFKGFEQALRGWVPDNQLKPTEEYRFQAGNKKVRIYQARAWKTGIDQSLLQYFDLNTMRLYQMEDKGVILITEKSGAAEVAVGIVSPYRI